MLLAAMVFAFSLRAEPPTGTAADSNSAPEEPGLRAVVWHEGGPGLLPVNRAYLSAGTNRFAFLIPAGFQLRVSEQQRVQIFNADYSCLLSVRVLNELSQAAKQQLDVESGRGIVLRQFPGAKIGNHTCPTICGRPGLGYTFDWLAAGKLVRRSKAILVNTQAGILELSLTTSPSQFDAAQRAFRTVLLTLVASDTCGKLPVAPISSYL